LDKERKIQEIELDLLLEAIFRKYNYDFRQYSKASVRRRIQAAMGPFDVESISALQAQVLHDNTAFARLLQFLTVPVTEMFRDPHYFRAIRELVVPHLRTYPSLKIWVAGCSTGEEAYSLAILLEEEELLERTMIYATDINPQSLKKAEAGIYNLKEMAKFTDNYQKAGGKRAFSDYYTAAYDAAAFAPRLKQKILFTDHSLATDSVFSEMHLISCRNVLIYFERKLQDRAIGLFFDSLAPEGFLGIGEKESLRFSSRASEFDSIDSTSRIYRKRLPHGVGRGRKGEAS
jgi:chemotaxis protein methyltransferase CheR